MFHAQKENGVDNSCRVVSVSSSVISSDWPEQNISIKVLA